MNSSGFQDGVYIPWCNNLRGFKRNLRLSYKLHNNRYTITSIRYFCIPLKKEAADCYFFSLPDALYFGSTFTLLSLTFLLSVFIRSVASVIFIRPPIYKTH